MIYYTSDLHLGNKNIIAYENRPWKTVEEMDAGLIKNWNEVVGDTDVVYVLGDFCFKGATKAIEYIKQLNGTIHFLRGNHDYFYSQQTFESWAHNEAFPFVRLEGWYKHFVYDGNELILCHFPILYWDGMDDRRSIHLYGHMHSRSGVQHPHKCAFNVGVDVNNYKPVTLKELLAKCQEDLD